MAVPLEQFVKQLEDSGILAGDTLQDFIPPKASPKDAEELARELVRHKKLTKFQAELIGQGKGKSLVLGNYVLSEKIGQGGMGAVCKAEHRRLKRLVAIKMLPPAMMKNAAAAARFQREVEAAAKLRHPNIVATDDADEANGVHFMVMECVEGSDLSALVKKNGPFSVAQAVDYVLQAAKGLEYAHSKGVVHRDIKPANLLLGKDGILKILDMGLARIEGDTAGQAELTGTGAVMGTVDYMPPEQALNTKTADARADIYSLGCSLFYLLSGRATYDGDTLMAKLLAHRDQPIPDLRTVCPQVSEPLDAVFKKMVAKKIGDRYQTMTEVIAGLERCGGGHTFPGSIPSLGSASDAGLTNFLKDIPPSPKSVLRPQQVRAINKKLMQAGATAFGVLVVLSVLILIFQSNSGGNSSGDAKPATSAKGGKPVASPNRKLATQANAIDPDRQAAMWALKKGGAVDLVGEPKGSIRGISDLPQAPFKVARITVGSVVNDRELAVLEGLSMLKHLELSGTNTTDAGLQHLEGLETLNTLRLGSTDVTDAGLNRLKHFSSLRELMLTETKVTAAGLAPLQQALPECRIQWPSGKQIYTLDAGLSKVALKAKSTRPKKASPADFDRRTAKPKKAPSEPINGKLLTPLQGDWLGVREELNGKPDTAITERRFTFADGKMTMTRKRHGRLGKYEGTLRVDSTASHFDFSGVDPGGKPVRWLGIYKVSDESLELCYKYVKDDTTTRPTEYKTDDRAGTAFVLVGLRREPPAVTVPEVPKGIALSSLKGTWLAVAEDADGKPVSPEDMQTKKKTLRIDGNTFVLSTSYYKITGTVDVVPGEGPQAINFSGKYVEGGDGGTILLRGIGEFGGNEFRLCYAVNNETRRQNRPTEMEAKKGDKRILVTFEKID